LGLRSVKEYVESLRDGREVYVYGEKVDDVTTHPMLKVCIDTAAVDYEMAENPQYRDLAVVNHPKTGEPISRHYYPPQNAEDLIKRHELIVTSTRLAGGMIPFTKDIGGDSMNAIMVTAMLSGNNEYVKRVNEFYEYLRKNDLSTACAMTDVKGDRSLHPSSNMQSHPDYYVHVVDKRDDGIIVRGAKVNITATAYCNEILVLPCRNMRKEDKDYAVCFAVKPNAKGLKHICHPIKYEQSSLEFPVDVPIRMHTESLLIFDDVFVPWERVFMCGEWKLAGTLVYNFAYFHRHTAVSYRIAMTELMLGMAKTIAEYNGIENEPHVIEKITDLVIYFETFKSLAKASCIDYVVHGGIAVPNPVISNLAKYHFASNFHNAVKIVQDLAGGIVVTGPTYKDFKNPELQPYINKYLGGKHGIPTEHRLRMIQLIRNWLASDFGGWSEILAVHGEGSLQAQRMVIYHEALKNLENYKKKAKKMAGIPE